MIRSNAIRGIAIVAFFLIGCPLGAALTPAQRQLNIQSFEYVWTAIRDRHWQTKPGGLDWQAIHDEFRPKMEAADSMDAARDLLAVGADVLDRAAADEAGNARETLDAADALLADGEDEVVPHHAGIDRDAHRRWIGIEDLKGGMGHGAVAEDRVDDEAGEAAIGDEEIAAATQDKDGKPARVGKANRFQQFLLTGDADKPARWAAHSERGVLRQWNILQNRHSFQPNSTYPPARTLAHHLGHSYNRITVAFRERPSCSFPKGGILCTQRSC